MAEYNKLNQEFYAYAGGLLNVSPQTAKKYWMGFVDTIIHILHFDGKCQMPSVGTFTLEELPERRVMAKNEQGELVEQINPAWFKILYKYNERAVLLWFCSHSNCPPDVHCPKQNGAGGISVRPAPFRFGSKGFQVPAALMRARPHRSARGTFP